MAARKRQRLDEPAAPVDPANLFAQFAFNPTDSARPPQQAPSEAPSRRKDPEPSAVRQPVIADGGGLWRERYASVCEDCYRAATPCPHFPEEPLRLLIIVRRQGAPAAPAPSRDDGR